MIRFARRFWHAKSGAVAIQIAIMLTIIIGFAALGMEITFVLFKQRQMQAASDAAAMGGAIALGAGYPSDYTIEAKAIAGDAGFTNGAGGTIITVTKPPTYGSHAGDARAIEVNITQPQVLHLVTLFRPGVFTIHTRAVALQGLSGLFCLLALDSSAASALNVNNNGVVANPNCGVAVNSSSSSALTVQNNAAINGPVSIHGQWVLANGSALTGTPRSQNAAAVNDPYASVQLQAVPVCTAQSGTVTGTKSLSAGHFCSGFNFANNAVVTLGAGAYYIDQKWILGNKVVINATAGVTLIVNGNYAVNIANNTTLNLTAPTSGPYAGIAIMGLRSATASVTQTFGNDSILKITGAIYFPNQIVNFENNSVTGATECTQVIARIINVSNNVYLNNRCAGTGALPLGGSKPQLVE
ncbi:MAG TPA: hypothetical protein VGT78_06795 [Rhizomicrobium sp.]|nr:hypothetical protein [Rhizomicrobium sp.]